MHLKSPRLLLIPLSTAVAAQRLQHSDFEAELEGLAVHFGPEWPGAALGFFPLIERGIMPAEDHFVLVRAEDREAIGLMGLKGQPNRLGEQEIGYGLMPAAWNQGYATEALTCLLSHLRAQPSVRRVTAETRVDNAASARVLHKCGFVQVGEAHSEQEGDLLLWATER